jgi:hypothetical protein
MAFLQCSTFTFLKFCSPTSNFLAHCGLLAPSLTFTPPLYLDTTTVFIPEGRLSEISCGNVGAKMFVVLRNEASLENVKGKQTVSLFKYTFSML